MCGMKIVSRGYYKPEPTTTLSLRTINYLIENPICTLWPQFSEGVVITTQLNTASPDSIGTDGS